MRGGREATPDHASIWGHLEAICLKTCWSVLGPPRSSPGALLRPMLARMGASCGFLRGRVGGELAGWWGGCLGGLLGEAAEGAAITAAEQKKNSAQRGAVRKRPRAQRRFSFFCAAAQDFCVYIENARITIGN